MHGDTGRFTIPYPLINSAGNYETDCYQNVGLTSVILLKRIFQNTYLLKNEEEEEGEGLN